MSALGKATNQLGQLFVDIGVGGLGQTLKALNSVSATFLLTKNAATQAIKPFVDMGVQAANSAVGIGKMAAALGTTTLNAQKLQYYLKQYKSEGLEGDVASLQQMFTKMRAGLGGMSGEMATSWNMIGLKKNWSDYSGSFEDTLQFIQDVKDALKTSGLSEQEKVMHLQNLGLGNWKYLFEKEDFDINKSLSLPDDTFKKLQKASEQTEEIKNNVDQIKKNLTTKVLEHGGNALLENLVVATGNDEKAKKENFSGYKTVGEAGKQLKQEVKDLWHKFKPTALETINDASLYSGTVEAATLPTVPNVENKTVINLTNNISGNNVQFEELTAEEENSLTGGRQVDVNAYTTHNGHDL